MDFKNVSVDYEASMPDGARASDVLCQGWPAAKPILLAIVVVIKNPILKAVITALIKWAENLHQENCSSTE